MHRLRQRLVEPQKLHLLAGYEAGNQNTHDLSGGLSTVWRRAAISGVARAFSAPARTALLPLVEMPDATPPISCDSTIGAMQGGIFWAVAGAAIAVTRQLSRQTGTPTQLFIAGCDGWRLLPALREAPELDGVEIAYWREMTLEGIRLTAAALSGDTFPTGERPA